MRYFILRDPLMSLARRFTSPGLHRQVFAHLMELTGSDPIEMAEDLRNYQGQLALGGTNRSILSPTGSGLITGSEVSALALFCILPEGGFLVTGMARSFASGLNEGWNFLGRSWHTFWWYMTFKRVVDQSATYLGVATGIFGGIFGMAGGLVLGTGPQGIVAGAQAGWTAGRDLVGNNTLQRLTDIATLVGYGDVPPFSQINYLSQMTAAYPIVASVASAAVVLAIPATKLYLDHRRHISRQEADRNLLRVTNRRIPGVDISTNIDRGELPQVAEAATAGFWTRVSGFVHGLRTPLLLTILFATFATRLYMVLYDWTTASERTRKWPHQQARLALTPAERETLKKHVGRRVLASVFIHTQ
jgi:hypothetical protein